MTKETCKRCNHTWDYKGKQEYYANCPRCMNKVRLQGRMMPVEKILEEVDQDIVKKQKKSFNVKA